MKRSRGLWIFAITYVLVVAGGIGLGFHAANRDRTASLLVLTLSDEIDESLVLERLYASDVHQIVSESTEWIYVEDFEGPRSIPLKDFYKVIEPLDPRNDGYAEKLKKTFASGGERRYFIPLQSPWYSMNALIRRVEQSLAEFKPNFQVSETSHVQSPWWISGLVLSSILLYLTLVSKKKSEIVLSIPAALVLLGSGIGGMVSTGLLVVLKICMGQFQEDLVSRLYLKEKVSLPVFLNWYKIRIINGAILVIFYILSAYFLNVFWLIALVGLVVQVSTGVLFTLFHLNTASGAIHRSFLPIELISSTKTLVMSLKALLSFNLGALCIFSISLFIPGTVSSATEGKDPLIPLTVEQYETYLYSQSRFSVQSLHAPESMDFSYKSYMLDSDGLLSESEPYSFENTYKELEVPPLESLLSMNYSANIYQNAMGQGLYLVIFIIGILVMVFRASHGQLLTLYRSGNLDKRIAA